MEMYETLAKQQVVQNAARNLTWGDPVENTNCQSNTSSVTVDRLALDMYVAMMVAGSAAAESVVAGSAAM